VCGERGRRGGSRGKKRTEERARSPLLAAPPSRGAIIGSHFSIRRAPRGAVSHTHTAKHKRHQPVDQQRRVGETPPNSRGNHCSLLPSIRRKTDPPSQNAMADDWEADDWEAEDFKPKLPATAAAAPQFETAGEAILARATGPDEAKFAGEDEGADDDDDEAALAASANPSQVREQTRRGALELRRPLFCLGCVCAPRVRFFPFREEGRGRPARSSPIPRPTQPPALTLQKPSPLPFTPKSSTAPQSPLGQKVRPQRVDGRRPC
jgi:hypothetical protein